MKDFNVGRQFDFTNDPWYIHIQTKEHYEAVKDWLATEHKINAMPLCWCAGGVYLTNIYSDGGKTYSYYKCEIDENIIIKHGIRLAELEYEKKMERKSWDYFANTEKPKPTIEINQYPIKKDGLKFKTKWR